MWRQPIVCQNRTSGSDVTANSALITAPEAVTLPWSERRTPPPQVRLTGQSQYSDLTNKLNPHIMDVSRGRPVTNGLSGRAYPLGRWLKWPDRVSGWGLMLSLSAAMGYGAVGGLVTQALHFWQQVQAWQQARHGLAAQNKPLPRLASFVDPPPDALAAVTRAGLGCIAGWLLHAEVSGMYAALIVGASAPALLAGLGKATTLPGVLEAGDIGGPTDPVSPILTGTGDSRPDPRA